MTLELDLTEVEAWEGGLYLSPGEHHVRVDDAKESTSTNGFPQLELQMTAVSGAEKGGQIRDWITVTPQSAGRVKQVLGALGVNVAGKIRIEATDLIGKHCQIIVRVEPDKEGKDRTRVKAYKAASATEASSDASAGAAVADSDDLPF